jgi:hypothetical protein
MVDTINPAITASIGQQQVNPLAMISQFAGAQNALNQNALFQQTYRARAALGPIAQQSVGPDGQMDWAKYAVGVSTHPDTAWMAPDILNQIAQKKLLDADTINAELTGYEKRMGITSQLAAAAYKDPNVKDGSDLVNTASDMLAAGGIKDGNRAQLIAWLTQMAPLKGTELKQRLGQFAMTQEAGRNALSQINGQFDPAMGFDPATGQTVPGWRSSVTGQANPLGPGGPPAGASGGGGGPAATPAAPTVAAPAGPTPSVPGGDPFAPGPSAAPSAPQPAVPAAQPSNFQYGSPGPAQEQKLKDIETMRAGYNNTAAHAAALQQVSDQLQTALQKVKAGAGAGAYQEAAKLLQSLGVSNDTVDKVANGSLPAGQTAETLATQLGTMAVRQLLLSQTGGEGSAGRLTNLEFGKIVDIFPNIENDPRAATAIFNFIRRQNTIANAKATGFNSVYNAYHQHQPLPGGMQDPTQFEPYFTQKLVDKGLITQGIARDVLAPASGEGQ